MGSVGVFVWVDVYPLPENSKVGNPADIKAEKDFKKEEWSSQEGLSVHQIGRREGVVEAT